MWWSIVGMGGSCFVSSVDKKTVLKGYQVWEGGQIRAYFQESCEEELAREASVYEILGEHPRILKYIGLEEIHPDIHALRLEYAPLGNVRQYIEDHPGVENAPSVRQRLGMALHVARGLAHVHFRRIWHSDLSCRNLFLFPGFQVKVGDFGAAILQGSDWKPIAVEEPEYELPGRGRAFKERPRLPRELFALGSSIYEIFAWSRVWPGVTGDEVDERFAREEFPCLEGLEEVGDVVDRCWKEKYGSAEEVVRDLEEVLHGLAADQVGQ